MVPKGATEPPLREAQTKLINSNLQSIINNWGFLDQGRLYIFFYMLAEAVEHVLVKEGARNPLGPRGECAVKYGFVHCSNIWKSTNTPFAQR